MKKLIVRLLIFGIPLYVYILAMVLVDPYNYFNISNLIDSNAKKEISYKLNYCIWKSIEFKRQPNPNILLGDSRVAGINTDEIKKDAHASFYNFAYGGATLPEIIDTFWFADRQVKLKIVYIGIGFNFYNARVSRNRFIEAKDISNNLLYYFTNRNVWQSFFSLVFKRVAKVDVGIGKVRSDKDVFWHHQLNVSAVNYYKRYLYPKEYYLELKKISDYCKINNIKLVFIVPATHLDLQDIVGKYGLDAAHSRFIYDLIELGDVYDFDYPNDFTRNKNNFSDPFHPHERNFMFLEVWERDPTLARYYKAKK